MQDPIWQKIQDKLIDFILSVGTDLLLALFILVVGYFSIRLLMILMAKSFRKYNVEPSLSSFIKSLTRFVLYTLLFVTVGTTLGIKTSSFVALIGAAGLAIGLALQGSLANFAGGVLILIFKPFKVGDEVKVNQYLGIIHSIDILYTRMATYDNRLITMPNGNLANADIDNWTMLGTRRVDLDLKFPYQTDVKQVREIILPTLKKHSLCLEKPEPDMWLDKLGEYDIRLTARCWCQSEDYWKVSWEQLEAVKEALEAADIAFSIPRQEISISEPAKLAEATKME
jgi:small conductance mechanosensitive channel